MMGLSKSMMKLTIRIHSTKRIQRTKEYVDITKGLTKRKDTNYVWFLTIIGQAAAIEIRR